MKHKVTDTTFLAILNFKIADAEIIYYLIVKQLL